MKSKSQHSTARRITGLILTAVLTIGLVNIVSTGAEAATTKPVVDRGKPVGGSHAKPLAPRAKPASSTSVVAAKIAKPKSGQYTLVLPGTPVTAPATTNGSKIGSPATEVGGWKRLGTSGIGVAEAQAGGATAQPSPAASRLASAVSVSILSSAATKAAGLHGLVISVHRTDGVDTASPIAVTIPNKYLNSLYGANFASRVRWVQVTSQPAGSSKKTKSAAVASATDTAANSTVVTPDVSSARTLLVPAGAPVSSSGTGSFAATPLSAASSWQVSAQTGDFSWAYAMRTPPAAAGPAPQLALNYDSQSVDGETGSTNNQPSAIGEGWSLGGGGFIDREYVSCSQDDGSSGPVTTSGDLCWKTDNATISFGGHSGQLVKDATTGVWKLQADDGTRIEHLVGTAAGCAANGTYDTDCWRVTTTDGTQYYFGLNELPSWSSGNPTTNSTWTVPVYGNDSGEPCHASTFAASSCIQAWRWNLDYVVDTHGNADAFYYDAETNKYAQNGGTAVSYTRGGQLDHIDYGFTTGNAYATDAAADRVSFGYAADGRCSDATLANCTAESITGSTTTPATPADYPDVPFDQLCTGSSCPTTVSPTFWTDGMLNTVTTSILTGTSYSNVDVWALSHSFPAPGDGTNAALWLTQIVHTGYSGGTSLSEPPTVFTGVTMQNRVWVIDGLAPLDKYRISSIASSTGSVTSVNYSAQQCTSANAAAIEASPQTNTYRCFPQWWSPQVVPAQAPQEDLFHKYVVISVIANPETGGGSDQAEETDYVYTGTPAWRYNTSPFTPTADRTWSVFAGYNTIEIRQGASTVPSAQQTTDYTFYQGMDGDRATPSGGTKTVYVTGSTTLKDSLWFAGETRETTTLLGVGGAVLSDTINTPWASAITANDGTNTARLVATASTVTTAPLSTGGTRTTSTATTFDPTYGLPLTVDSTSSDAPAQCTTTSYAPANTTAWLIGLPDEVAKVGADCANLATAVYPAAAISDTRTSYDGAAWGVAPTKGDATTTQTVDSYTGTTAATAHWVTSAQDQYDSLGRVSQSTDVLGHSVATAYIPAAGASPGSGPTTSETTTNTSPFSWTSTTVYNPAWGVETSTTDANSKATTATYDALGRRTAVWDPDNPQASNPSQPSIGYSYTLSTTSPNVIETSTLDANTIVPSYALYDGLGRQVQAQSPAEGGGADVSDTWYDSVGRTSVVNASYWTPSVSPSTALFVPSSETEIPSETITQYDAAGRTTATILDSLGAERFRTTIAYPGVDRTDTTPPSGGTPTTSITNSLGEQTQLIQYLATAPLATATQESTTYGYNPSGAMAAMTDPAGNHWTWSFDVLGHQTSAHDPDTGTTSNTYDDAGNVLTSADARGQVLAYTYDALNRRTGEYSTSTSGSLLDSWVYDTLAKGQLTSSTSYTGSTPGHPGLAYSSTVTGYSAGYEATGTTVSIPTGAPAFGGTSYTTSMAYDTGGAPALISYSAEGGLAAERLRIGYDGFGNEASLSGTSAYAQASYTATGQPAEYQRNGTATLYSDYGYDMATGAIDEISQLANYAGTYTTLADSELSYDNAGNVTSISTTSSSLATDTQCFGYDYLQNLNSVWTPSSNNCTAAPTSGTIGGPAPYWDNYTIDPATGNRLSTTENATTAGGSSTTDTYAYPTAGIANPHAVQTVSHLASGTTTTSTYGYDADGDTTTRPGQVITYDAEGKVSTITAGTNSQADVYDASGNLLLQKDSNTGTTLFLGATQLHLAAGATVASAVRTYTVNGTPVAERSTVAGVSGSIVSWLATDAQGTVDMQVTAATDAVTVRMQDPFGQARGAFTTTWSDGHGFLNATTDTLSGLVQLGARMYDPALGRFLSVDTVLAPSNPQQNNGYSYGANSPVENSDPSGDCYIASTGALDHNVNCAGGQGVTKASADNNTSSWPATTGGGLSDFCSRPSSDDCQFFTSANVSAINKQVNKLGAQAAAHPQWSPFCGILCNNGPQINAVYHSTFGHLVLPWAYGLDSADEDYGPDSELVKALRKTDAVQADVAIMAEQVREGNSDKKLRYDAGSFGDSKSIQDAFTLLNLPNSSQSAQVTLALGSYALKGYVVGIDVKSRTATIAFSGSNNVTLGSALATAAGARQLGQAIAPPSGAFSEVHQSFGWLQTISY